MNIALSWFVTPWYPTETSLEHLPRDAADLTRTRVVHFIIAQEEEEEDNQGLQSISRVNTKTTAAISAAQHAEAACVPISLQLWDLRWDPGLHSCHSPPVTNSFFVLENIFNPLKVTVFWVSKSSCQLRVLLLSLYNDDNTWIATSKRRMKNISSLPFYVLPWVFVRKVIFLWQKFKSVEYFIA